MLERYHLTYSGSGCERFIKTVADGGADVNQFYFFISNPHLIPLLQ
jgi:hypothetical protein